MLHPSTLPMEMARDPMARDPMARDPMEWEAMAREAMAREAMASGVEPHQITSMMTFRV